MDAVTTSLPNVQLETILGRLHVPQPNSHKGQNGKVLIIGGSTLFHAASVWSLTVAARIVDMVFYSSVVENNELVREAKQHFWEGVVVPRGKLLPYLEEADVVLIGPGMERQEQVTHRQSSAWSMLQPESIDWEHDTYTITNFLLAKYPQKKWVVDAGALQMIEPDLLRASMLLTPHRGEFQRVFGVEFSPEIAKKASTEHQNVTILAKAARDMVVQGQETIEVSGGNAGMTKGGTGDVLAGLAAALYATNDIWTAAVAASYFNKLAGDELFVEKGPFFTATELANQIPLTMHKLLAKFSIHG